MSVMVSWPRVASSLTRGEFAMSVMDKSPPEPRTAVGLTSPE
jgi:hypothetical protein